MFDGIFDAIEEWMRELLTGVINTNLDRMFTDVNQKTGEIAGQVGMTPENWNSSIFQMIHNLSDSVIVPIAGMIITFVLCYELISMVTEKNNMHDIDTWMFFKYFFKMWVAVYLVSHTFDITMAVFDLAQYAVNQASGVIAGSTALDIHSVITGIDEKLEVMNGVEYTVEDTGTFAKYGVDFDVYYSSHSEALAHGHKTWEAYVADDNGSQSVEVTQTSEKKIFTVKLSNRGFDQVAKANLSTSELMLYELLNSTYGNRDYLFDKKSITNSGGGWKYDIPSEALSDERFAKMITEAEKYLGYPYVWGGASPETSFDCSGFVCWVINHCGNGWSVGRMTAEGLRGACTYVSPQNAKPGDLIFFEKTYETVGASHVGIYVGDGMMIHCGDPIQYTSINSAYWQEHFLGFGRLP